MTDHARSRLRDRQIPVEAIRSTLENGVVRRSRACRAVFDSDLVRVILSANGCIVTVCWRALADDVEEDDRQAA